MIEKIARDNKGKFIKGNHYSVTTEFKKGNIPIAGFKKGHKSGMTGKKHSEYSKEKSRLSHLGQICSEETRLKRSIALKGKPKTEEWKKKIGISNSISQLGNKNRKGKLLKSEETRKKLKLIRATRIFPIKDTSIEVKIQNFLNQLGIEYYTHKYITEIEHSYQCDIFIPSKNMVIECDGNYWHCYPTGREIDNIRTKELIDKGFKVLRLWESKIKSMDINEFQNQLKMEDIISE